MGPRAFGTPQIGYAADKSIAERAVLAVRSELGAIAAMKAVLVVEQLPKTRSGKILRSLLRKIVNREPFDIPATIDDPETPAKIAAVYREELGLDDPHLQNPGK